MLNHWHIALRAENGPANHWRSYELRIDRDLMGTWLLTVQWGRIGAAGTRKTSVLEDIDDAWLLMRSLLRRRQTAPKRIGCNYRLVSYHLPEGCVLEDVVQAFA
jgi:predicted DNA-binding WGR domain protein